MSIWYEQPLRQRRYLKHLLHLVLVSKEKDAPVFAGNALDLSDHRVNDRGLVRIRRVLAIQHICLGRSSDSVGYTDDATNLVNDEHLPLCALQNRLCVLFRLSQVGSDEVCRIFDHH